MRHYLAYSTLAVKEGVAFKINLFTSLFGGVIRLILLVSVWKAIYIGKESMAGYSEEEILFYIVIATAMSAGGMLSAGSILGERNFTGDIIVDLIRPVSIPWCYFFISLGRFYLRFWIKVIPTLIFGLILVGYVPFIDGGRIAVFVWLFLGGAFLHFWLELCIMSFTFKTKSSFGLGILWTAATSFLAGLVVPIAYYPPALHNLILWTPFPSMVYTPISVLMGNATASSGLGALYQDFFNLPVNAALLIEQISWILLTLPLALRLYRWNEKGVEAQGG